MLQRLFMDIASRIREARAVLGWTQRDLAARIKVSPAAVAQWETGQTMPSIANRADLSRLLRIPFIDLVPETSTISAISLKNPLIFSIIQQVLRLPPRVQEALLMQVSATAEALDDSDDPRGRPAA